MAKLLAEEIEQYRAEGWVVPRFRLPEARVAAMAEALDALLRENPGVRPEKLVSAHVEGDNGEGVRGSRAFLDLARDPEIVELVSGVLGDDLHPLGLPRVLQAGRRGLRDALAPGRPLLADPPARQLHRMGGARGVEPGERLPARHPRLARGQQLHEHLHEDRSDLTLNQRLAAGSFDEASAVDIELQPGEMSLHDVYMIHGANANRSTKRRTGVALRYMPTTSVFERDLRPADGKTGIAVDFANRPLWLVRGRDRSGRNDLEVGHRR